MEEVKNEEGFKTYIGIKMIEAFPAQKDGKDGYKVLYPDGYVSWSPKDAFEAAYLSIHSKVTMAQPDIDQLTSSLVIQKMNDVTGMLQCELVTGFTLYETSTCIDPNNYSDQKAGAEAALKANLRIWQAMAFIFAWATNGLKHLPKMVVQQGGEDGNNK